METGLLNLGRCTTDGPDARIGCPLRRRPAGSPPTIDMETEFLNLGLDIIGLGVFNYDFGSITRESPVIKVRGAAAGRGMARRQLQQRGSPAPRAAIQRLADAAPPAPLPLPRPPGGVRRAEGGGAPLHLLHPVLEPAGRQPAGCAAPRRAAPHRAAPWPGGARRGPAGRVQPSTCPRGRRRPASHARARPSPPAAVPRQRRFRADLEVINQCLNELIQLVGGWVGWVWGLERALAMAGGHAG